MIIIEEKKDEEVLNYLHLQLVCQDDHHLIYEYQIHNAYLVDISENYQVAYFGSLLID